jgi:hypothetical protein
LSCILYHWIHPLSFWVCIFQFQIFHCVLESLIFLPIISISIEIFLLFHLF